MSTMLEQAIVDAKALREAAVKSAEAAIVEKYNDEPYTRCLSCPRDNRIITWVIPMPWRDSNSQLLV